MQKENMLVLVFLLVIAWPGVLSQRGVFEPYTFQESSCTGNYKWTMWFDTNDPNPTQGDMEMTSHITQLFPNFMCRSPIAIEGQTSNDQNPTTTGDIFRITVKEGFLCLNQQIAAYKNKLCSDYKVRYCCPATSI